MRQVISAVTRRIEQYSTSAEAKEMEACFFDFQEIGAPSRIMKNLLIDHLESRQAAQSASQKPTNREKGMKIKESLVMGLCVDISTHAEQ